MSRAARRFLADLGAALGIDVRSVAFTGTGVLAGPYPMTDLGAACLAGAGAAVAGLVADAGEARAGHLARAHRGDPECLRLGRQAAGAGG